MCVDLGGEHVIAHNGPVAAERRRLAAHEVVVFIGDYQEQRVVLGDAGVCKPREERTEGLIIGLELVDIFLLAWTERVSVGGSARFRVARLCIALLRIG